MYIDEAVKLVKKYKWNSLFMKYFKKFVIVIFIPFLILISLTFLLYKHNISNFLLYNVSNDYHTLQTSISSALSEASTLIEFQNSNASVSQFIYSKSINFSDAQTADNLKTISSLMSTFVSSSNIDEIILYSNTNKYVYSTTTGCVKIDDFRHKKLIDKIVSSNNNATPFIIIFPEDIMSGIINVISVTTSQDNLHSVFIVRLNLNNILQQQSSAIMNDIFITYDDQIIFSSKNPSEQIKLLENPKNIVVYSKDSKNINISNKVLISELAYGLTFAVTFSVSYYQSYKSQILLILLLCIILSIILPIILSFYFSMQYYHSISQITYQIQHDITENTLNENIDEINFITNNITQMSDRLKNAEGTLTEKLLTLEKLKIQVLQNQINPHFIFNTLNSISLYIQNYFEDDSDIVVMLNSLSDIISELLSTSSYMTSIAKEIQYSKKYLAIELIKQMNTFDVFWEIDESLSDRIIPKMILQPIIENALNHGIYPLLDVKKTIITIVIHRKDNNIELLVSDNGVGFDETTFALMSEHLENCDIPQTKHIGLLNVNFRIKSIYGNEYGVRLLPAEEGSKISILIPLND